MNKYSEPRDVSYVIKENQILKQENDVLRNRMLLTKTSEKNETMMADVIDLQRQRITNLELGKPFVNLLFHL